jgi:cobalamin synthase
VSNSRSQRPNDRYGNNQIRPGFVPGLLGSAAAVAGLWANGTEWMITILFAVSIFAAIIFFFCVSSLRADDAGSKNQRVRGQSRVTASVFAALLVIIVVVYNPVVPFVLTASGTFWQLAQVATGAVLFAAGVLVKTPSSER